MVTKIPRELLDILKTLNDKRFEAYVVGGCVRDLLLDRTPKDWDVTTNASPEEIQNIFPDHVYENDFGTVSVKTNSDNPTLKLIEITPYRLESSYSDKRHPDKVTFTKSLEKDLARRDFTINAVAMNENEIIDPFNGQKDIETRTIKTVGDPDQRFAEDALRLMRAVRFSSELDFDIEKETLKSIEKNSNSIADISQERVRDELTKIVMSERPEKGFNVLQQVGLLNFILPEVAEGVREEQNRHHVYTVYEHSVKSLQFAADFGYNLEIRLAALLHDIGKPRTRGKADGEYTFHGHEVVSMHMARKALQRLCFSTDTVKKVTHLIRYHMFYYDVGKVSEAGARRMLRRIGKEHFDDIIKLRKAERKGSGVPKAEPYRLRHLQYFVEKASQTPITTSELTVDGHEIMKEFHLKPGRQVGGILNALLAEVLDDPDKNTRDYLLKRAEELKNKDPIELKKLGEEAKDEAERIREEKIRQKYHV